MALAVGLVLSPLGLAQDLNSEKAGASTSRETPELHLGRGHDYLKHSRYEDAAREFQAALALNPHLGSRARFPLGVALFNLQERAKARSQFERMRSESGSDAGLMYYLGRLDLMEGDLDAAIVNLTLAADKPPFPDTAYYLGYAYLKKGELATAESWLQKAAEWAPRDFRVQERLGLLYRSAGRKEEAEKAFALSGELHKRDVEATGQALDCGRSLETRPFEEARAVCEKLDDPQDVGKLVTLGTTYGQYGHYREALEPLRRAAELEPNSYELQYNLGLTYFRLKRYAEARTPLEKAVALRPDMFETNAPLGATLYALGDDPAAYQVLSQAHELNPQNTEVADFLFNVATTLAQKSAKEKEYALALQYQLKAASLQPEGPEPHWRLANIYTSLGERQKADKERREAERLSSTRH